jgi:hypothetical protein
VFVGPGGTGVKLIEPVNRSSAPIVHFLSGPQGVRAQAAAEYCQNEHCGSSTVVCVHVLLEQAGGAFVCSGVWMHGTS